MNPLVKKEIRLLLPTFIISCVLALANLFVYNDGSYTALLWLLLSCVACPLTVVMLALESFGAEVSAGTFSNLLAQPVPRQKIWETKIRLLALAFLLIGFVWCAAFCGQFARHEKSLGPLTWGLLLLRMLPTVVLFELAIFSGALWTVLLLRQVAAAFWFTLLIPGMILVTLGLLLEDKSQASIVWTLAIVLGLYSVAGFFFARWLFFRAQDVQWTGGNIALPEMRGLAWLRFSSGTRRQWRPRAALLAKELQLQQSQLVVAGVLVLLHLGVVVAHQAGHFHQNSVTLFVLEIFWALWLAMPLLVGCAASAEERKLGTLAGQLCLPVRSHTQFALKAAVVLLLSLVFGTVIPLLLEGTRILPDVHFLSQSSAAGNWSWINNWQINFQGSHAGNWFWTNEWQIYLWLGLENINQLAPWLAFVGMAAAVGLISFYASTLSRNTLQALAPAVLGISLAFFLFSQAARGPEFYNLDFQAWRGRLIYVISIPALAGALLMLAGRNSRRLTIGWRVSLQNLLALLVVLGLAMITTTAIYHRAWEKLGPFEPPHGEARLTLSNPATLPYRSGSLSVRLPDGRIWTSGYMNIIANPNPLEQLLGNVRLVRLAGGHFDDGSNWVDVANGGTGERVGIKTDGTLWVSEHPPQRKKLANGTWQVETPGRLVRYGSETNWGSFAWDGFNLLLVKKDGTLWRWGAKEWDLNYESTGLRTFTPTEVDAETNWAEVFKLGDQPWYRKTDNSVWASWIQGGNLHHAEPGFYAERVFGGHGKVRSLTKAWSGALAVLDDGTFHLYGNWQYKKILLSNDERQVWRETDMPFGNDTNWLAVAGYEYNVATLKDDGTLWAWNPLHGRQRRPVRLGIHSDWIAIASADGGIVSLAADGSLWYWTLESADYMGRYGDTRFYNHGDSWYEPWLDVPRKPQRLGNIFNAVN